MSSPRFDPWLIPDTISSGRPRSGRAPRIGRSTGVPSVASSRSSRRRRDLPPPIAESGRDAPGGGAPVGVGGDDVQLETRDLAHRRRRAFSPVAWIPIAAPDCGAAHDDSRREQDRSRPRGPRPLRLGFAGASALDSPVPGARVTQVEQCEAGAVQQCGKGTRHLERRSLPAASARESRHRSGMANALTQEVGYRKESSAGRVAAHRGRRRYPAIAAVSPISPPATTTTGPGILRRGEQEERRFQALA